MIREAIEEAIGGQGGPNVAVALKLAALLDDPDTPVRDVAGLSRELRQVLGSLDLGADVDGAVFDLEARRKAREARRA